MLNSTKKNVFSPISKRIVIINYFINPNQFLNKMTGKNYLINQKKLKKTKGPSTNQLDHVLA